MNEEHRDFCSCSPSPTSLGVPRLEYLRLVEVYPDSEALKCAIVNAIWNDDRLYRNDIEDIAHGLLRELKGL